jgi:putative Ig domain-containing protein
MLKRLVVAAAFLWIVSSFLSAQDLQMQTLPAQTTIAGQTYVLALMAHGGVPPYSWQLVSNQLPPGLKLNGHTGRISGIPTTAGEYSFSIAVTDSNVPAMRVQHDYTIRVIEGLSIEWKEAPAVHGNSISGSAIVTNQTGQNMVLTLIVVAVNQTGRATALGYQHFTVVAGAKSPVIPFNASPGNGTYSVRADAAAHQTGHRHVFRAGKQTPADITVTQF